MRNHAVNQIGYNKGNVNPHSPQFKQTVYLMKTDRADAGGISEFIRA